jgi:hypothetical protein
MWYMHYETVESNDVKTQHFLIKQILVYNL